MAVPFTFINGLGIFRVIGNILFPYPAAIMIALLTRFIFLYFLYSDFRLNYVKIFFRILILLCSIFSELYTAHSLVFTPVAPKESTYCDITIYFYSQFFRAFFLKVKIYQLIHLASVIERINAKHCDIHMWILHPRIFPVNQMYFILYKQKIIGNGIYVT